MEMCGGEARESAKRVWLAMNAKRVWMGESERGEKFARGRNSLKFTIRSRYTITDYFEEGNSLMFRCVSMWKYARKFPLIKVTRRAFWAAVTVPTLAYTTIFETYTPARFYIIIFYVEFMLNRGRLINVLKGKPTRLIP